MIIENNGIKLDVGVHGRTLTYTVLEQTNDATDRIQSVTEVLDPESNIKVRSNRFPSFNAEHKRIYLRGLEKKKDNKTVEANFASAEEASKAAEGLKRIVDFLTAENFPIDNAKHGQVRNGGTSHCRFYFINRAMAKILCLTGHNHYPVDPIKWKKSTAVVTKNKNYNTHIKALVGHLNASLSDATESCYAVDKVRSLFKAAFAAGPNELVACWRTITGLRSCDDDTSYENEVASSGGTLKVRNGIISKAMATTIGVKYYDMYKNSPTWIESYPVKTGNVHYDEHIGQIVDVLNKNNSVKEYSDNIINHHKVGTKSAKFVMKMIREAFAEAQGKGPKFLCALWDVMTGLRGPDFTD